MKFHLYRPDEHRFCEFMQMWNLGLSYSTEYLPSEDLIKYNVFGKSHNVIINTTAGNLSHKHRK